MEVSSGDRGSQGKSRAQKAESAPQSESATDKRKGGKNPRSAKVSAESQEAQGESSTGQSTAQAPESQVLTSMIATAAYFIAEQRNFEPGHELEDWLTAERQVLAFYQ